MLVEQMPKYSLQKILKSGVSWHSFKMRKKYLFFCWKTKGQCYRTWQKRKWRTFSVDVYLHPCQPCPNRRLRRVVRLQRGLQRLLGRFYCRHLSLTTTGQTSGRHPYCVKWIMYSSCMKCWTVTATHVQCYPAVL